jgi:hypothetical protein
MLQNGSLKAAVRNIIANPAILYRGILPNATSMIPITAVQVTLNNTISSCVSENERTTIKTRLACAFAAGMGSALISCPVELIMTKQQATGYSFTKALVSIASSYGIPSLYRGITATMLREGPFTMTYLAAVPILNAHYKSYGFQGYSNIAAGVSAGLLGTVLTHWIDVIKTRQQSKLDSNLNFFKQANQIYQQEGLSTFSKGMLPRGARIISAVSLMGYFNGKITDYIHQDSDHENPRKTFR